MKVWWRLLLCQLRGHDLTALECPGFTGRAIRYCRRCHHSADRPARRAGH